jgi:tRNA U38,U39,U40 pseudouridine synthase TruA
VEGWGEQANTVETALANGLRRTQDEASPLDAVTLSTTSVLQEHFFTVAADTGEGAHAVANVVTATLPRLAHASDAHASDAAATWLTAVNRSLPSDVVVFARHAVPAQFHAATECDSRR